MAPGATQNGKPPKLAECTEGTSAEYTEGTWYSAQVPSVYSAAFRGGVIAECPRFPGPTSERGLRARSDTAAEAVAPEPPMGLRRIDVTSTKRATVSRDAEGEAVGRGGPVERGLVQTRLTTVRSAPTSLGSAYSVSSNSDSAPSAHSCSSGSSDNSNTLSRSARTASSWPRA